MGGQTKLPCESLWRFHSFHSIYFWSVSQSSSHFKKILFFSALIGWGPKLEQQDPGRNLDKRWVVLYNYTACILCVGFRQIKYGATDVDWESHLSHHWELSFLGEKLSWSATYWDVADILSCVRLCLAVEVYQMFKYSGPQGNRLHILGIKQRSLIETPKTWTCIKI